MNRTPVPRTAASLILLYALSGCSTTTTVTTETVTRPVSVTVDEDSAAAGELPEGTEAVEQVTTTKTTTHQASSGSILGNAFSLAGSILVLPFKLLGTALGAIF